MGEGIHTIKRAPKTDRSYLRDTDSGMNRQEAFRVNQLESKIRNRKTEKGYVIGANGEIIAESVKSSKSAARFYTRDLERSKDAILTHNHPNADMGGTMAARIGLPFSDQDVRNAIRFDQKEVRAVTPNYTYSIRRPKGGWGDEAQKQKLYRALDDWNRRRIMNYNAYKYSPARLGTKTFQEKLETFDRGNVGGQWSAWKKFMKETGLTVTRRKVSK